MARLNECLALEIIQGLLKNTAQSATASLSALAFQPLINGDQRLLSLLTVDVGPRHA